MRALVNGVEGAVLDIFKGQDKALNILVISDLGIPEDLTGDTVTLEFYDRLDRKNAATLSVAGTLTAATAGHVTGTLTDTNTGTLTAGLTYYLFIKRSENVSSDITWATSPAVVKVR